MVVYATAIIPLIYKLIESLAGESITAKNAEYADDLLAIGSLTALYIWRNHICEIRPKLGYFFGLISHMWFRQMYKDQN